MTTDYDVIIIGAGPAGASCAKHLVDNGVKTLVVEKKKLPREKSCAGMLNSRSLSFIKENFGEMPDAILCSNKFYDLSKVSINGKIFLNLSDEKWGNVKRKEFDYWLIGNTNSDILDDIKIKNIIYNDLFYSVELENGKSISSRYIVGCDGSDSFVRKCFFIKIDKEIPYILSVQRLYKCNIDIEKNIFYCLLNPKFLSSYTYLAYKDDNLIIGGSFPFYSDYKKYFSEMEKIFEDSLNFNSYSLLSQIGCKINILNLTNDFIPGENNLLLAGEAGGFSAAYGEGISSALYTGQYSAESIIESLADGNSSFFYYNKKIKQEINYINKTWGKISKTIKEKIIIDSKVYLKGKDKI